MARDAHDATWRALSRIADVLCSNTPGELRADAPGQLNVDPIPPESFYVMANDTAIRYHVDRNHNVQVYIWPSGERERHKRTNIGTTTKTNNSDIEISITVRVVEEAGADPVSVPWKTELTQKEREFYRCETYLGAIMDVMDGSSRGPNTAGVQGDDIVHVEFIDSRTGDERMKLFQDDPGTWGTCRWLVRQVISIPVQN